MTICSIEGCEKPRKKKSSYCSMHVARRFRHGDASICYPNRKAYPFFRDVVLAYEGDECLKWPFGSNGNGYGRMMKEGKKVQVHREVCEEINGPPPTPAHQAAHSCGNGHLGCCAKRHLTWKTPKENAADTFIHGTHQRGENSAVAKLKEDDVLEIRRIASQYPHQEIADRFGIHKKYIQAIVSGKRWRHLP